MYVSVFLFSQGHRPLSIFFEKWPEILKIFRTILYYYFNTEIYGKLLSLLLSVTIKEVKLVTHPEHFGSQQEHYVCPITLKMERCLYLTVL